MLFSLSKSLQQHGPRTKKGVEAEHHCPVVTAIKVVERVSRLRHEDRELYVVIKAKAAAALPVKLAHHRLKRLLAQREAAQAEGLSRLRSIKAAVAARVALTEALLHRRDEFMQMRELLHGDCPAAVQVVAMQQHLCRAQAEAEARAGEGGVELGDINAAAVVAVDGAEPAVKLRWGLVALRRVGTHTRHRQRVGLTGARSTVGRVALVGVAVVRVWRCIVASAWGGAYVSASIARIACGHDQARRALLGATRGSREKRSGFKLGIVEGPKHRTTGEQKKTKKKRYNYLLCGSQRIASLGELRKGERKRQRTDTTPTKQWPSEKTEERQGKERKSVPHTGMDLQNSVHGLSRSLKRGGGNGTKQRYAQLP